MKRKIRTAQQETLDETTKVTSPVCQYYRYLEPKTNQYLSTNWDETPVLQQGCATVENNNNNNNKKTALL